MAKNIVKQNENKDLWEGSIRMEKRYTIGVMIGNANSPHTMNLMQGTDG